MKNFAIACVMSIGAILNAQNYQDSEEYKAIMDTVVLNTADDLIRMNSWCAVGMVLDRTMNVTLNTYKEYYADKEFIKKWLVAQKTPKYSDYYNGSPALIVDILVKYWDKFDFKLTKDGSLEMYFAGEYQYTFSVEDCRYPNVIRGRSDEEYVTIYDDSEPVSNMSLGSALMSNVYALYGKYGIYHLENRHLGRKVIYEPLCYYRYIRYDIGQGFRWLAGDAPQYVPENMLDDLEAVIQNWHSGRAKAYIIPLLLPTEFAVERGRVTPSQGNMVISIKDRNGAVLLNDVMMGQLAEELSQFAITSDYMCFITDKTLLRRIYEKEYGRFGNPITRILLDNLDVFDFKINGQGELEIYVAGELTWKQKNDIFYDETIDNRSYVSNLGIDRAYDSTGLVQYGSLYKDQLKKLYEEMAPDIMDNESVCCSMVEYRSDGEVKFYSGDKTETSPEVYKKVIEIVKLYCESNNFSRVVFPLIADLRKTEEE